MQLSLLPLLPQLEKRLFHDVYVQLFYDARRHRLRLRTIRGQFVPPDLHVGCPVKALANAPEGTLYKVKARLVRSGGKQPYFLLVNRRSMEQAVEFLGHVLSEVSTKSALKRKRKPPIMPDPLLWTGG